MRANYGTLPSRHFAYLGAWVVERHNPHRPPCAWLFICVRTGRLMQVQILRTGTHLASLLLKSKSRSDTLSKAPLPNRRPSIRSHRIAMPKPKGSKSSKTPAPTPTPQPPPSWPAFKPPLPVVNLTLNPHPLTSKVVLVPSFFPRSLCRDYVSFLKTLPLHTTPGRPKRGEAVRVNDRFQVDSPDFAIRLWEETGLKEALLEGGDAQGRW